MKTVELETLQLLLDDMKSGRVRPEHLARFHRNPDVVLASAWVETMLGLIPPGAKVAEVAPSHKLLCIVNEGGKEFVMHGDNQGKRYASVSTPQCVRGSLIYGAGTSEYSASNRLCHFIVCDDAEGEHYDTVRDICHSPNGIYYVGALGKHEFLVEHGVKRQRFDKVGPLMIWQDLPLCSVEEGGQARMFFGDHECYFHDAILRYTTVDKRLFLVVKDAGRIYSVADGQKGLPHDNYLGGKVEDGRPLYVMFDGPEQKPTLVHGIEELTAISAGYKNIREPGFGGGKYFFAGETDEGWYVVHGQATGPFPHGPLFPWYGGNKVMFIERTEPGDVGRGKCTVRYGEQVWGRFNNFRWIGGGGDKLAYLADEGNGWLGFLTGEQQTNGYDVVGDCVFEDGKFLMKVGCHGRWQAVWGRDESRVYDQVFFVKQKGEGQEEKTLVYATKGRKVSQLTIE